MTQLHRGTVTVAAAACRPSDDGTGSESVWPQAKLPVGNETLPPPPRAGRGGPGPPTRRTAVTAGSVGGGGGCRRRRPGPPPPRRDVRVGPMAGPGDELEIMTARVLAQGSPARPGSLDMKQIPCNGDRGYSEPESESCSANGFSPCWPLARAATPA